MTTLKQEMMMQEAIASAELAGATPQHTQDSWKERFNEAFSSRPIFGNEQGKYQSIRWTNSHITLDEIKSFIQKEKQRSYQEGLRRVGEVVEKESMCNQCRDCLVENTTVLDCADEDCDCHTGKIHRITSTIDTLLKEGVENRKV